MHCSISNKKEFRVISKCWQKFPVWWIYEPNLTDIYREARQFVQYSSIHYSKIILSVIFPPLQGHQQQTVSVSHFCLEKEKASNNPAYVYFSKKVHFNTLKRQTRGKCKFTNAQNLVCKEHAKGCVYCDKNIEAINGRKCWA